MLLAVVKLSHKKLTMILALFQIALATVGKLPTVEDNWPDKNHKDTGV